MTDDFVDLSALIPVEQAEFEVLKPGGIEGSGWKITFGGPSHPKAVAWIDESSRRDLRRQARIEQAQINSKKYKVDESSVEEMRARNVQWVVSRILNWTPVRLSAKNPPIRFSDEAAMELLVKPEMAWALLQMMEFLNDERAFTPRSAETSSNSQSEASRSTPPSVTDKAV